MGDLSHWIFANDFTAHEAAYLILGVDPSTATDGRSARHIKERMGEAYAGALKNLGIQFFVEPCLPDSWFDDDTFDTGKVSPKFTLISVEIERLSEAFRSGDDVSTTAWLEQGRNDFLEQRFSRVELARWLDENQLVSAYSFAPNFTSQVKEKSIVEKPLSNRERDTLLSIIAALCKDSGYDYTKAAKTAGLIQSTAAAMGVSIGETTIENHLKKIPDALAPRMK